MKTEEKQTPPRDWLITRFDFTEKQYSKAVKNAGGPQDLAASVILHLKELKQLPLSMVVDASETMLEAWWDCKGKTQEELEQFFNVAATLGADHETWDALAPVRLPGGTDENGRTQRVIYWDESTPTIVLNKLLTDIQETVKPEIFE